jgi:hypothetical protein
MRMYRWYFFSQSGEDVTVKEWFNITSGRWNRTDRRRCVLGHSSGWRDDRERHHLCGNQFLQDEVAKAVELAGTRANLCGRCSDTGGKMLDKTVGFTRRCRASMTGASHLAGTHAPYTTSPEF